MPITITEAIAELKTINARVDKKRKLIQSVLARQEAFKDPHEKEGGSVQLIARETQAINDLLEHSIKLRQAIQVANQTTLIDVMGETRSIADWLVWRREVAPGIKEHYSTIQRTLGDLRKKAQEKGWAINATEAVKPTDLIINVNETELAASVEKMEEILGTLDGQLSLKNATVLVEI